jgi:hypothetical protein
MIVSKSIETVAKLIYLITSVTNQNYVYEGIKRKLNPRNACCQSVQNLLSSL